MTVNVTTVKRISGIRRNNYKEPPQTPKGALRVVFEVIYIKKNDLNLRDESNYTSPLGAWGSFKLDNYDKSKKRGYYPRKTRFGV